MSSLIAGAAPLLPHTSLLQVAGMRMSGCEVGMKDRPQGKAPWRVLRVSGPWRPPALQALLAALLPPEAVAEGRLVPDCIDIHGGPGALTAEAVAGCSAVTALPALSLCPPPGGFRGHRGRSGGSGGAGAAGGCPARAAIAELPSGEHLRPRWAAAALAGAAAGPRLPGAAQQHPPEPDAGALPVW